MYSQRTDRTHTHEWVLMDPDEPFVLEDGAAIFHYTCCWAPLLSSRHSESLDETFEERGEECEEEISIRLEPADTAYHKVISLIEEAWNNNEDIEVLEIDSPHPQDESGKLVLQFGKFVTSYEAK